MKKIGFLEKIFSIKREDKHKVITFMGVKIKYKCEKIKNCVAIIDCGGIGDYTFCRPYFKYFKQSEKFKDCKLLYFCKKAYESMPKTFDKDVFYKVLTYDEDLKSFFKKIKKYEINTVINLFNLSCGNSFRGWPVRYSLVRLLNAKCKIADITVGKGLEEAKYPNIYNKKIYTYPNCFELERRRQFFEQALETEIPKTSKQITPIVDFKKDYICISLFTAYKRRNYPDKQWILILNHIAKNIRQDVQILFLGGPKDAGKINKIINKTDYKDRCINIAGYTDITLVPSILAGAKLLLSPETGTVHLADSVGCKTVCITCGSHYGRFLPYSDFVEYVYPDGFETFLQENKDNKEEIEKFYQANWTYKTADIAPEKVIKILDKYLKVL